MLLWLRRYRRAALPGDIGAGIVVAMMMIPQGMAYALLLGQADAVTADGNFAAITEGAGQ